MGKAHRGKKLGPRSPQAIENMRRAITGRKLSEEHKAKLRGHTGENSYHWKGGITPLVRAIRNHIQYQIWRLGVFSRDNFTCQKCGVRGSKIAAHHFPRSFSDIFYEERIKTLEQALGCELFWDINNGITLCDKCHKKSHSKGGR
jgi:hypothetical protein